MSYDLPPIRLVADPSITPGGALLMQWPLTGQHAKNTEGMTDAEIADYMARNGLAVKMLYHPDAL